MPKFRDALLIMRAWVERGSAAPLRVSIRHSEDLADGLGQTITVTSPEAGSQAVKAWLDSVVEADRLDEAGRTARL